MTPYTKIFMKLAEKDKNLLLSLQYPQRVLNLLLDTNHEVAELEKEDAGEGYFGHDASIKEK